VQNLLCISTAGFAETSSQQFFTETSSVVTQITQDGYEGEGGVK